MEKQVIRLIGISRHFKVGSEIVKALRTIDITINRNEYVALMGPSGSGKSTLMNLLGCLDTPTSGEYFLNGQDVSKMNDSELADIRNKEIGFIFQTFNLLPRSTALENVMLPLVYAGIPKQKRIEMASAVIEDVQLTDRMKH
ncbi:MAG: ABC transporter ATP-binding protein, partial [Bacteroidales bacterium]